MHGTKRDERGPEALGRARVFVLRRASADEQGFTLVELMVAMALMVLAVLAIFGVFDATSKLLVTGHQEELTAQEARAALETMERDVRYAHPMNITDDPANSRILIKATATELIVGNDVDGDGRVSCPERECAEFKEVGGKLVRSTFNADAPDVDELLAVKPDSVRFEYSKADGPDPDADPDVGPAPVSATDEPAVQTVALAARVGAENSTEIRREMDLANRR